MDDLFPDINAFSPWELNNKDLDELVAKLLKEVKSMYKTSREYNVDFAMSLRNMINHRKMALWSHELERVQYASRKVKITFDEDQQFFKVFAEDGEAVLLGYPACVIKQKDWFAASDGHGGTNAIVYAPKDEHAFLERLFADPRSCHV